MSKDTDKTVEDFKRMLEEEYRGPPPCFGTKRCWYIVACDYGVACIDEYDRLHPWHGTFLRKFYNWIMRKKNA